MRGPGFSLGTLIFLYAINLGRNQVTDDSAERTNCFCHSAKKQNQRHA
jgi:hypothetical protein